MSTGGISENIAPKLAGVFARSVRIRTEVILQMVEIRVAPLDARIAI